MNNLTLLFVSFFSFVCLNSPTENNPRWAHNVKHETPNPKQITVAQDGSGDFKSIQAAIESLRTNRDTSQTTTILIKNGTYREKIFIDVPNIILKGETTPAYGKTWAELTQNSKLITHNSKNTEGGVKIIFSEAREIFRCNKPDDWGSATMNIRTHDVILENLTVTNDFGYEAKGDSTFICNGVAKVTRKDGHQFALRCMPPCQRLTVQNCNFYSWGGDTVSPWDVDNGTFFFKKCTMEGAVDFYCPRGWAYAEDCFFICHNLNAAIWHDGTGTESAKTVLKNCQFVGDKGYKLGRFHRDAQFFLVNCQFSQDMADDDIYQVRKDTQLVWGKRVNYYNCHRAGGDFAWHKDNLDKKTALTIDRDWTLGARWNLALQESRNKSDYGLPKVADAPKLNNPKTRVNTPKTKNANLQKETVSTVSTTTASAVSKPKVDSIAERMLIAQRSNGGWAKTVDGKTQPPQYKETWGVAFTAKVRDEIGRNDATIDNGGTNREISYLAKAYEDTQNENYKIAAEKGIAYLLSMQYKNGGFPQFFPDTSSYRKHITFNDDALVNTLETLRSIAEGKKPYEKVGQNQRLQAQKAVDLGVDIILKTQIISKGRLTIWCAQHHYQTLEPVKARAFELASFSGKESVSLIEFLMSLEKPSPEVKTAINAAVKFLDSIKIVGFEYKDIEDARQPNGKDRVLVKNKPEILKSTPSVIWARFYDLDTHQPFFCGRDGVKKATVGEIEHERRTGYAWYTTDAKNLFEKAYPKWYIKHNPPSKQGITNVRDTSYANFSAFQGVKKSHPNAGVAFVSEEIPPSVSVQKNIVFEQIGERKLALDAFLPSKKDNKPRVAVLIIHGGGWRTGNRTQHHALATRLAASGYACFTPEYRLSTEALYPAAVHDLKAAIRWLRANAATYNLDTNKIAVAGFSAGGQLAALLGTTGDNPKLEGKGGNRKFSSKVHAVIDLDGILAFVHPESGEGDDSKRPSAGTYWFGYTKLQNPDLWKQASALTYVGKNTPPTLFINSSVERMHAGREDFIKVLNQHGIYSDVFTHPDSPHSFPFFHPWFEPTAAKMEAFLKKVFGE
jgi:PelA/Pel-15E family pectate lyase